MNYSRRLMNGGSRYAFFASCGTAVAALPLAIWLHDNFFSLCLVRGSSMEPTLFDGDILVVRKSDGFWQRWTRPDNDRAMNGDDRREEQKIMESGNKRWAIERKRMLAYEREHCNSNGSIGLLRKPPIPIKGDIVVFKDPGKYPDRWNIKRAVAFGGQLIPLSLDNDQNNESMGTLKSLDTEKKRIVRTASVPPYSIWVEGDNRENSIDSRDKSHGPVSKKLLVGIVEHRVWPPWRIGKFDNMENNNGEPKNPSSR